VDIGVLIYLDARPVFYPVFSAVVIEELRGTWPSLW
jgi:hypothetical protein